MPLQTANLTAANQNISVGSASQVFAAAADTLATSPDSLSIGVTSNESYGNYTPTATESASISLSFQVPISGLYNLAGVVTNNIGTSIDLHSIASTVSLTGVQGPTTVFSAQFSPFNWAVPIGQYVGNPPPVGQGIPNPIEVSLTSGTTYTMLVSTSDDAYTTNNPGLPYTLGANPGATISQLTITPVPEPTTATILFITLASLTTRRRFH